MEDEDEEVEKEEEQEGDISPCTGVNRTVGSERDNTGGGK